MKKLIKLSFVCLIIAMVASSCASSGYGCTGRSKWITGYNPNANGKHYGLTWRERRALRR